MQRYLLVVSLRDSLMAEDAELSERVLCAVFKAGGGAWRLRVPGNVEHSLC